MWASKAITLDGPESKELSIDSEWKEYKAVCLRSSADMSHKISLDQGGQGSTHQQGPAQTSK